MGDERLPINAVLCDAEIKGSVNGFALRAWIKEHRPDLQVILSGSIASAASAAADLCEQGPQLARPYDPHGVVDHIKRLLAKRDRG